MVILRWGDSAGRTRGVYIGKWGLCSEEEGMHSEGEGFLCEAGHDRCEEHTECVLGKMI